MNRSPSTSGAEPGALGDSASLAAPDATVARIVILEDDEDTRANLQDILELDGYAVETAGSLAEARRLRAWDEVVAVVLDRRLPDGAAEDFLPELARRAPDAAVVVVTGNADVEGAVVALRHGATDYILKPVDADTLRVRIRRIVEHRADHLRLKQTQRRLQALFDGTLDGILMLDDRRRILEANPAAVRLLGRPVRELLGRDVTDCLSDGARPAFESLWSAFLGDGARSVDLRLHRPPAEPVDVECHLVAHVLVGLHLAVLRDVTARRRAEEALRAERNFAESVIRTAQAIVLVLSPEGEIVRFNRYLEKLTGRTSDECAGKDWFSTFLPARDRERTRALFRHAFAAESTRGNVTTILCRDGSEREIAWWDHPLEDDEGRRIGLLAIGHDVSELRTAERRLVQSERLAAVGKAMAGLVHESRNALQRSQACLEMLSRRVADRPEALGLIRRLQTAQDDLHRLYEEVREYAAPIVLDPAPCSVSDVLRETWDHLRDTAGAGREVVVRETFLDEDGRPLLGPLPLADAPAAALAVSTLCRCDRFAIRQVFRNVLENSLAACADPVGIDVRYRRGLLDGSPALEISLRDDGPGLTSEQAQRIFEEFYTTKTHGTGLGMAICRRLVEAHGGRIETGPADVPGAEIRFTLPGRLS